MARDLFAGTALYYARHRPGYPQAFLSEVGRRFSLPTTGRLLDLGCGPGTLTIALADQVREAVGVDPEPDMIAEATRQASRAGARNIRWLEARAENLPRDLGRFQLVTMGRSFHWMDRAQVLATLAMMISPTGGLVIVNDNCLVRPATDWQRAIEEIQTKFVGAEPRAVSMDTSRRPEPHQAVIARSSFRLTDTIVYEFKRPWTTEQIIGYLYSTSLPLSRLLGDRRDRFEEAITETLRACSPNGQVLEPVRLEAIFAAPST